MNLQRMLLRLMLVLLGAAAAVGVLAVFLSTQVIGRVALTALVGAISIAIAIPVTRLLDSEKTRWGGLLGLGSIVVSMILFLGSIWVHLLTTTWDVEFKCALNGLFVLVGGVLGAYLLPALRKDGLRWAAGASLLADAATVAAWTIAVWIDLERVWETGAHIAGAGVALGLCLVGMGKNGKAWQLGGVIAALAQLVLGLLGTWFIHSDDPTWYVIAACVAVMVGHANAVHRVPAGDAGVWAKLAAIGGTCGAGVATIILCISTGGFDVQGPEILERAVGAMGIVAACGTMAVFIMYRLAKRPAGGGESEGEITGVQIVCPNCGKKRLAPLGISACDGCKLVVAIKVEKPRCRGCDFSLLGIRGEVCPECGKPIQVALADDSD